MRKVAVAALMTAAMAGTLNMSQSVEASPFKPTFRSYSVAYNAHWILSDQGFVKNKTTFMSVTDVVYVIQATGLNCAWGNDNLIMGNPLPVDEPKHVNANATIYLNGREFESIPVVHLSNTTGNTYVPIWYVMQALEKAGQPCTWNGRQWIIGHLFA